MPSVIDPSLTNSVVNVAANYLKADPSTQFGTRQLSVIKIAAADIAVDYALSDSLYSQTVRALQQTAEVWAIFTPVNTTDDYFHAIISADSQWAGDSAHQGAVNGGNLPAQNYGVLETALAEGTSGSVTFTVTVPSDFVAAFNG